MSGELVTVASFLTMQEADMARGFLKSNGFEVFLGDGAMLANHLTPMSGGINLRVFEEDAETVRELLAGVKAHPGTVE